MTTNRQQYLLQKYSKQIHMGQVNAKQVDLTFTKIINADPTHTGKYMDWLLRCYFDNSNDFDEKFAKIQDWLRQFEAEKKRTKALDINCFTSISSLRDFIRLTNLQSLALCLANTPPTLCKLVKTGDIEIILESERITIYKLNSFAAAKYFSHSTKWCSSTSENHFEKYKDGLYVIKTRENLYQLHLPSSYLADSLNLDVCEKEVGSAYPEIWQALKHQILNSCALGLIPEAVFKTMSCFELKDYAEQRYALDSQNYMDICWLPLSVITQELCDWMIAKGMVHLNSIPRKYVNLELCVVAVEVDIYQIADIPEDIDINNWIQKQLKLKNTDVLHRISLETKYDELTIGALEQDGMLLYHIPYCDRNIRYCDVAVRSQGIALKAVPDKHLDRSVCIAAIKNNPLAIAYVPDKIIDLELVTMAINLSEGEAVNYIPQRFIGLGYRDIDGPAEFYQLITFTQ